MLAPTTNLRIAVNYFVLLIIYFVETSFTSRLFLHSNSYTEISLPCTQVDMGHAGTHRPDDTSEAGGTIGLSAEQPKDHRGSHSSISHLVVGAQVMVSTVNAASSCPDIVDAASAAPNGGLASNAAAASLGRSPASLSRPPMHTSSPFTPAATEDGKEFPSFSTITPARGIESDKPRPPAVLKTRQSRHNIPDIVEQVMKRRLLSNTDQTDAHHKDSSSEENAANASSDEDLFPQKGGRPPSYSDPTNNRGRMMLGAAQSEYLDVQPGNGHAQSGTRQSLPQSSVLHGKPRSASDPPKKHRRRNVLYRIAHSERKKDKRTLKRHGSLENLEPSNQMSKSKRRSGIKSDGDDLSDDGYRVDGRLLMMGNEEGDRGNAGGTTSRTIEAVRSRGREFVGGMKYRGTEMKNWTRRKIQRADSLNSEADLELDEIAARKTASKWRARVKAARIKPKRTEKDKPSLTAVHFDFAPTLYDSPSIHLWVGKDYVNWITKDINNPDEPFTDSVERHRTPRMPWHDIGLYVEGAAARDVARHFIQRWNAVKTEKVKNNAKYPYLLPRTYDPSSFRQSLSLQKQRVRCQVVRSIGQWSGGQHDTERSIYNAYLDAVRESKHYIYIENQFFISSSNTSAGRSEVQNRIAAALVDRIEKAHRSKSVFRVFVLLPLLPAFEGQIGTPSGTAMQFILHYTYSTIIRSVLIQSSPAAI